MLSRPEEAVASAEQTSELERWYPELGGRIARIRLTQLPTRVHVWQSVSDAVRSEVWIKRDDESSPVYGGNKPRKLEFLLAEAKARGRRAVLTFGGLGTHHGLAAALFSRKLGLACWVGLLDQPLTAPVRDNLLCLHAAGARLFYGRTVSSLAARALWLYAKQAATGQAPAVIPTGGSAPAGTVAFVNAALEFAAQVHRGECPCPRSVYVALGSGGTAAGLALGLALAGLPTEVRAVLVTDIFPPSEARLIRMAGAAWRWLRSRGAHVPKVPPSLHLRVVHGFQGRGYGWPSPPAEAWRQRFAGAEGVWLDATYTAKCVHGMIATLEAESAKGPVLFWHTFSKVRPEERLGPLPDYRELPREFHRFFHSPTIELSARAPR